MPLNKLNKAFIIKNIWYSFTYIDPPLLLQTASIEIISFLNELETKENENRKCS